MGGLNTLTSLSFDRGTEYGMHVNCHMVAGHVTVLDAFGFTF